MAKQICVWRIYHPNNWKPDKISGKNYTDPPVVENHTYLIEAENDEGEFDSYLIGTIADKSPTLTEYWNSRGWKIESKGTWEKVNFSRPEDVEIIEVHNCWTVYGTDPDGSEVEQPIAQFSRPQDWGHPRWHYERFRFDWVRPDKHYINHVHCWTDLQRQQYEYPQLFAPLIVQILMPGHDEKLCGRDYLEEDDFWSDEWGPMPPYYDSNEEAED